MNLCYLAMYVFLFGLKINEVKSLSEIIINREPEDYYGFDNLFRNLDYDVSGKDILDYQWYHNRSKLPMETTDQGYFIKNEDLTVFSPSTMKMQGIYQLYITSKWGKIFGREIKVEYTIMGKFKEGKTQTKDVVIGQSYRLQCPKHSFSRHFVYKWGAKTVSQGTVFYANHQDNALVLSDGTLFFSNVVEDDVETIKERNGIQCLLEVGYEQDTRIDSSSPFLLNIVNVNKTAFGPTLINIPDQVVDTGKDVIFRCIAAGYPTPSYKWEKLSKDGKRSRIITSNGIYLSNKNKILTIISVRELHAGTYICIAQTSSKTTEEQSTLTVKARPVWVKGSDIKNANPYIFSQHVWTCLAKGDPQPEYKWYANTTIMKNQSGRHTIEGGILTFHKLTLHDNGLYQCTARNKYGFEYQTVSMDVKFQSPIITKLDKETTLIVKKTGVIVCEAEAIPKGVARWLYNGAILNTSTSIKYEIANDTNLVINNVDDNDAGIYTCVVQNMFGKATKDTMVKIGEIAFTISPKSQTNVPKGVRFDLGCKAASDPPLNIRYKWRFEGKRLNLDRLMVTEYRILVLDSKLSDSGTYECVAYITEPIYAENVSAAKIIVRGVPDPPENLTLQTTCTNFEANLSWAIPYRSPYDPLKYLQLQWSMSHDTATWYNVSKRLDATRDNFVVSGLNPWSKISFRLIAVNDHGMSSPSRSTNERACVTPGAKPTKCPDNVKGAATMPSTVEITWQGVAYIHRNGPGFNYIVSYRKPGNEWKNETIQTGPNPRYLITNAGIAQEWEFTVKSNNSLGTGPDCAPVKARSEKEAPSLSPQNFTYVSVGSTFVVLAWQELKLANNVVLGYKLSYWQTAIKRRRRSTTSNLCENNENKPCTTTIPGSNTTKYELKDLLPYKIYSLQLQAYNNGGNGPKTAPALVVRTATAKPSAPTHVKFTPYGKYIRIEWAPPSQPNGQITGYNVAIKGQEMNGPRENKTTNINYLFTNLIPNSDYEVVVQAKNSAGAGDKTEEFTKTTSIRVPAVPKAPDAYGVSSDSVNVTFIPGDGDGGFQEKFYVKYKEKGHDDKDLKSSKKTWINGGKSYIVVDGLDGEKIYMFAAVVTNDKKESAMSGFTEGQPILIAARESAPIYKKYWFYIIIAVILLIMIILLILFLRRKPKETYKVSEREKKHAAKTNEDYPLNLYDQDDSEQPHGKMYGPIEPSTEKPLENNGSVPSLSNEPRPFKSPERDSLDDYDDEEDDFSEQYGSFIGQYGPGIKATPSQSSFSNFV